MKNMKKLASLLLALVMILALAVPAMAVGETTGSIEVTNPQPNETYDLYKILDLSYGGKDGETNAPHTYTINDAWKEFINSDAIKNVYVDVDAQGYVTWHQNKTTNAEGKEEMVNADPAEFAEKAIAYAKEHNITPVQSITPTTGDAITFNGKDGKGLTLGYYLVDSSLGSLCTLDTTNLNAKVTEKNDLPTLDKTITSISNNGTIAGNGKSGTASYGATVTFNLAVGVPATAVGPMTVHDVMDSNLTYVEMTEAPEGVKDVAGTETGDGVTVCTKEFTIPEDVVETAAKAAAESGKNETINITYTATVNSDAPINTAMLNTAHLTYSKYNTQPSVVEVHTYQFTLSKVNSKNEQLTGAEFELYDAATGDNKIALVAADGGYRVATPDEIAAEGFTSAAIEVGSATIKGLSNGTYYLQENVAPEGYNKLKDRFAVNIVDGVAQVKDKDDNFKNTDIVSVQNLTGAELPSTGGIGTTLFYIVGGLLIVGAAVLLITKKRVNGEQ